MNCFKEHTIYETLRTSLWSTDEAELHTKRPHFLYTTHFILCFNWK